MNSGDVINSGKSHPSLTQPKRVIAITLLPLQAPLHPKTILVVGTIHVLFNTANLSVSGLVYLHTYIYASSMSVKE